MTLGSEFPHEASPEMDEIKRQLAEQFKDVPPVDLDLIGQGCDADEIMGMLRGPRKEANRLLLGDEWADTLDRLAEPQNPAA